jgi:hypothetical protein
VNPAKRRVTAEGKNVVSLVRGDCRQLFCVFAGVGRGLRLHPMEFLERARLVDRNLVLFRDPFRADYRRGLGADLPDFPSLIDWQRQRRRELPHVTDTYCVGSSMGGLPAMRLGYHLRARTVWAFAPRPYTWYRARRTVQELVDLLSTGNGVTEYRIYYSVKSWADRRLAATLSTCPGVVCYPQESHAYGFGHFFLGALVHSGTLSGLFPAFAPAHPPSADGLVARG